MTTRPCKKVRSQQTRTVRAANRNRPDYQSITLRWCRLLPPIIEIGDWKPAQPNDQNLGGEWWKIFQDPQLDALELQVNISNQNLKAAEAQFRQARAALRYNRADYY